MRSCGVRSCVVRSCGVRSPQLLTTQLLTFFSCLALTLSCGVPSDRFRIEGRFRNTNQIDLYLCNLRDGTKDTLRVTDGRFSYETQLDDTCVYVLMFPNFSELPVIAQPGAVVKIDGDVSHLKETTVKGTTENELVTDFRMAVKDLPQHEVTEQARQFIAAHATSPLSVYLLRRYFIQSVPSDYERAYELCSALLEAQPTNVELVQTKQRLGKLRNMRSEGRLPHFSAKDRKGRVVSDSLMRAKVNVIIAWAAWCYDSHNIIRQMKTLGDAHPHDLSIVTVCLDASESEGRNIFVRDSLKWPDVCDALMWESPLVERLGLAFVPDNIVTDAHGNIKARSLKGSELRAKVKEMLGE